MSKTTSINASDWTEIDNKSQSSQMSVASLPNYLSLVWVLVMRDFKVFYQQTVLGPLWLIIQPTCMMVIYSFVFGRIARMSTDSVPMPLFYLSSILLWHFLVNTISGISGGMITNGQIFSKVYFPRIVVPISTLFYNGLTFLMQLGLFSLPYFYYVFSGRVPLFTWQQLIWIPYLAIYFFSLALGIGLIVSSLTVRYRDLNMALGFVLQIWMYTSPVLYSVTQLPKELDSVARFNPASQIFVTYRGILFNTGFPDITSAVIGISASLLTLFIGIALFNRAQRDLVDHI